jgi:D-glycero-D-manno-heptose 1,7-bisphosphate phosphatase
VSRFVFLDRDGTLVADAGYTHRLEDYALLPGVAEGLRRLRDAGYRFAVVTNQSGIARGLYDEAAFRAFQRHLERDLARHGIALAASYCCPHLPDAGCGCRKPAPGMLLRARDELGAQLAESFVVGDSPADIGLAERAGCRGAVWIRSAEGPEGEQRWRAVPRARDLCEAAALILACGGEDQSAP